MKPLGYKLTPIDSRRHLAVTRNENGRLHAWIESSLPNMTWEVKR
jgi:hypothetical protein